MKLPGVNCHHDRVSGEALSEQGGMPAKISPNQSRCFDGGRIPGGLGFVICVFSDKDPSMIRLTKARGLRILRAFGRILEKYVLVARYERLW